MLTSISVSSIDSITTMLTDGIPVASVLLSFIFIGLVIAKEIAAVHPDIDEQVGDALTAALLPLSFAFITIVILEIF